MIKVIKKEDAIRRLFDDPEWPVIERHIKTLNKLIDAQPHRASRIREHLKMPENMLSRESELVLE